MKTSELIGELAEVIEKYGDLPAFYFDGACTHEPAVIAALRRKRNTVDSTWIWENIPPLTEQEVEVIMAGASVAAINQAYRAGAKDRRFIAAYLKATAHLDVQPGQAPLVNPINKALLEALKRLVSVVDIPDSAALMQFARQAIAEAEKGLGENLGSLVNAGSKTEVRGDSFLQALLDIQAETDNRRHDVHDRLHRITILVNDLINSHLAKAESSNA
jgi:hypothetical protein